MKKETVSLVIDNFYIQWLKIFHIYHSTWVKNINLGNWLYGSVRKIHILHVSQLYQILRKSRGWLVRHSINLARYDQSYYRSTGPALITLSGVFEVRGGSSSGFILRNSGYSRFNIYFRRII